MLQISCRFLQGFSIGMKAGKRDPPQGCENTFKYEIPYFWLLDTGAKEKKTLTLNGHACDIAAVE